MSGQYEPEVLKKLQQYELEILRDFIKICEENDITYFGLAGTGIGALRHGGFIPWDDDIDLGLLYDDYIKVLEIYKRDYSDKYTVVNATEYPTFACMNTHITLNDSRFVEECSKHLKHPQGIFLDLFPFYKVPQNETLHKKQAKKAWLLGKVLILKNMPFPNLPFKGIKAKIVHCITAVCWAVLKVFCPYKLLYNCIMKECLRYQDEDTGKYEFFFDTKNGNSIYTDDDIFPIKKLPFDGIMIAFPNRLEERLTALYGDFMQVPPPEKRKNHRPLILEFPKETPTTLE